MAIGVWNTCEECGDTLTKQEIDEGTDLCGFCTEYEITLVYRKRVEADKTVVLWKELFG